MTASPISPVSDLAELLATMAPALNPGRWAWCTLRDDAVPAGGDPVATMREPEGLKVVVAESDALAHGWPTAFRAAWIALRVHSDLAAVGLTAAFARALGDAGIACNVVAGVHHDPLFAPVDRADDALAALRALQARASAASDGTRRRRAVRLERVGETLRDGRHARPPLGQGGPAGAPSRGLS